MHRIYKGKLGYYILTDQAILAYCNGSWKIHKSYVMWVMLDLIRATMIDDLQLLVLTGVSKEELQKQIEMVQ